MESIRQAEDLMRQASALMIQAERLNLKHPEALDNTRQAFVQYTKAVYLLLGHDFPEAVLNSADQSPSEAGKLLGQEISRLSRVSLPMLFPYTEDLPRVLVQAVFWSSFAGQAAAACREANLRPGSLFGKHEAVCAVAQAKHCHKIVKSLIDLKK